MKHHLLYDWKDNEFRLITDVFEPSAPVPRRKSAEELKAEKFKRDMEFAEGIIEDFSDDFDES